MEEDYAKAMGMKAHQLATRSLVENSSSVENSAQAGVDDAPSAELDGVRRQRKTRNADIEAGYSHSVALRMTIAAIQTGQRVTFDDATQAVVAGSRA